MKPVSRPLATLAARPGAEPCSELCRLDPTGHAPANAREALVRSDEIAEPLKDRIAPAMSER